MQRNRLDILLEMLEKQPDDPFLIYGAALEYVNMNDAEHAWKYFEKLLNAHPDYLGGYYQAAVFLGNTGRIEDALAIAEKGMQLARRLNNNKTYNELNELKETLEDM